MMTDKLESEARRVLSAPAWVRATKGAGLLLLVLVLLYYPVGMLLTHEIDDDLGYQVPPDMAVEGGSQAVAMAAALVRREIDVHPWVANDPWFLPGAALDNMPNFQQGLLAAVARFSFELVDQVGRARGSSQTDADLQEASGQLQYSGHIWYFDFSTSLAPTTPSEDRYRKAYRSLLRYNERLAAGNAVFERRTDNLQATLNRIALDLGASSAALEDQVDMHSGDFFDFHADDTFYSVKGQLYGYTMILGALGEDFGNVLAERDLATVWGELMSSMRNAAALQPWVVVNGPPDGQFGPSHLTSQGFYLMRARTRLREITAILEK